MPSQVSVFTDKQLLIGVVIVAIPIFYMSYKAKGVVDTVANSDFNLLNPDNRHIKDFADWWVGLTYEQVGLTESAKARLEMTEAERRLNTFHPLTLNAQVR